MSVIDPGGSQLVGIENQPLDETGFRSSVSQVLLAADRATSSGQGKSLTCPTWLPAAVNFRRYCHESPGTLLPQAASRYDAVDRPTPWNPKRDARRAMSVSCPRAANGTLVDVMRPRRADSHGKS